MLWQLTKSVLTEEIKKIGAHEQSIPIFNGKSEIVAIKMANVRTPAANILKQEMLACGGDAVTPMSTILGEVKFVDVILLGTRRQYALLVQKLEQMPFFGLDKWHWEIDKVLQQGQVQTVFANGRVLDYQKTLVMGIINVTPDSFFAGSRVAQTDVLKMAEKMLHDGADILDIGGESTRPGAEPVTMVEEQKRVLAAVKVIREKFADAIISVDTYHGDTAEQALAEGADIINDITCGADVKLIEVVKKTDVPMVLTHNGAGGVLQVAEDLNNRLAQLGLSRNKVILDPGIGFGKTAAENLQIIRDSSVLTHYGYPVLIGASRKSVIGSVLDLPPAERLEGTLAVSAKSVADGIQILRVHDVKENVRVIRMAEALR